MFRTLENKLKQEYGDEIQIHKCDSTDTTVKTEIHSKDLEADIIVVINENLNISIVWNMETRREKNSIAKSSLTCSKKWQDLTCNNQEVKTIYKTFKTNNGDCYEKIIVLENDTLYDFSVRLPEWLEFDPDDEGYPENLKRCKDAKNKVRTKSTSSRWNRDRKFSKAVLEAYDYKCAICRCNISQLLEAAHERGFEVCNTEIDMIEHGICLCRNHHAMYDKKDEKGIYLIDIDLKGCTINVNDERIKEMQWYQEFCDKDKYDAKLLKPIKYSQLK